MSQDDKDKDEDELEWDFVRLTKLFFRATKENWIGFCQVDETLFGEPLSRQLLNRSKSMEAISGGGKIEPQNHTKSISI